MCPIGLAATETPQVSLAQYSQIKEALIITPRSLPVGVRACYVKLTTVTRGLGRPRRLETSFNTSHTSRQLNDLKIQNCFEIYKLFLTVTSFKE